MHAATAIDHRSRANSLLAVCRLSLRLEQTQNLVRLKECLRSYELLLLHMCEVLDLLAQPGSGALVPLVSLQCKHWQQRCDVISHRLPVTCSDIWAAIAPFVECSCRLAMLCCDEATDAPTTVTPSPAPSPAPSEPTGTRG